MTEKDRQIAEAIARDIEMSYEMLMALVARHEFDDDDEWDGAAAWEECKRQSKEAIGKALALARAEGSPQGWQEIAVDAYQKAQGLWSSQCFCFTSAPEQMRRDAHEVARDGFNELVQILGPVARPALNAEYKAAEADARLAVEIVRLRTALERIAERDHVRDATGRPPLVIALERWEECTTIAKEAISAPGSAEEGR